jgi:hypothetical protein
MRVTVTVDTPPNATIFVSMTLEQIRKRLTGGFQPFVIRTSDGREFKVPHPEFVMVGKFEVAVVDSDGHIDTIAPLHITSIKSLTGRSRIGKRAA